MEEAINIDLRNEVHDDDCEDAYELQNDGDGQHDHHIEEVAAEVTENAEDSGEGQKADDEETDEEKDDDSAANDDAPVANANNAMQSVPSNDKMAIKVPKESDNTAVIGLKVYTNKDVGCSVVGRLRIGCKVPNCTLCAPPVIVTIPASEKHDGD